jgi:hypothetical protein
VKCNWEVDWWDFWKAHADVISVLMTGSIASYQQAETKSLKEDVIFSINGWLNINEDWYAEQKLLLTNIECVYVKRGLRGEEEQETGGDRVERNCIISILH